MSRFVVFQEQSRAEGLRTKLWAVASKKGGSPLGMVGWYAAWRRYCFMPEARCVFDAECLLDIAAFMEDETKKHKAKSA